MRLLLIEDEEGIGTFISQGLREAGLGYALHHDYAVVVLDRMLPRMDRMQFSVHLPLGANAD